MEDKSWIYKADTWNGINPVRWHFKTTPSCKHIYGLFLISLQIKRACLIIASGLHNYVNQNAKIIITIIITFSRIFQIIFLFLTPTSSANLTLWSWLHSCVFPVHLWSKSPGVWPRIWTTGGKSMLKTRCIKKITFPALRFYQGGTFLLVLHLSGHAMQSEWHDIKALPHQD